ncbi:Peptidase S1, PA clan [Phytophthora cactorum]|nr:Peptidase S1, PA clan [Phytophthora cactorum]
MFSLRRRVLVVVPNQRIGYALPHGTQDGEQIKVVSAQNHTGYNSTSDSYDVALLTLEKPSKFKPVQLPAADDSDVIPGMRPKLVGWGYTSYPNGMSLEVWSNTDCAQIYHLDARWFVLAESLEKTRATATRVARDQGAWLWR